MGRKNNIHMPTPLADATNTPKGDDQIGSLHKELLATPVPPNCRSSKPKTTEQIMAKRARERARYAKAHPIQKRTRKDSPMPLQSKNGHIIGTETMERCIIDLTDPVYQQSSATNIIPTESGPMRSCKRDISTEQRQTRRVQERKRYAAMTEEQRSMIRKRQRKPETRQKKKTRRQMKKDALCPESIAMENPAWVSEMESPAQHAANLEAAWNDDGFFNPTWRPLFIPPKSGQSLDPVNNDANDMTQVSRHRNVTHGERQALRTLQNHRFEDVCLNRPSGAIYEEDDDTQK